MSTIKTVFLKLRLGMAMAICCSAAIAENLPLTARDIVPGTNIDNPEIESSVAALLDTYNLLRRGTEGKTLLYDETDINFYFASGSGYIKDERLAVDALVLFEDDAVGRMIALPTNTDTCYVQNFRIDGERKVTVVVHNEDFDYAEDVYRCLAAGLWWFSYEDFAGFDGIQWRKSFVGLFDGVK